MSTCEDCIHYEMCSSLGIGYWGAKPTLQIFLDKTKPEDCGHFKDRSKFVELPFEVESTLYFVSENDGKPVIEESEWINLVFNKDAPTKPNIKIYVKDKNRPLGKAYAFFYNEYSALYKTRQEAEQALKAANKKPQNYEDIEDR